MYNPNMMGGGQPGMMGGQPGMMMGGGGGQPGMMGGQPGMMMGGGGQPGMMMGGGGQPGMMMGGQSGMMMGGGQPGMMMEGVPPYDTKNWSRPVNNMGIWMCVDRTGVYRCYIPNMNIWMTQNEYNNIPTCPPQQQQYWIFQLMQQQASFMQATPQFNPMAAAPGTPSPTASGQTGEERILWTQEKIQQLFKCNDFDEVSAVFASSGWDTSKWLEVYNRVSEERECDLMNILAAYFTTKVVPSKMEIAVSDVDLDEKKVAVIDRDINQDATMASPTYRRIWETKAPPTVMDLVSIATKDIAAPDESRRVFEYTEVRVGNIKSLELARQLRNAFPDKRIAVLNMTHPRHPGGSWKKGQLSQEECNFLQTCISASLDDEDYPLDDYDVRYSKDVPVIRGDPDFGHPFLSDDARWTVDFVSICGINLKKKGAAGASQFTSEVAVRTRAKVEAMLSACVANGATFVVLGALGCGAFQNPPQYVSAIFKAVLEQYAGFFQRVYFAVYSSTTEEEAAKEGRIPDNVVFTRTLVGQGAYTNPIDNAGLIETSVARYPRPPRTWTMTTTDAKKPICEYCGRCTNYSPEHRAEVNHPPECPMGEACTNNDDNHRFMFCHMQQAAKAGLIKTGPQMQQQQQAVAGAQIAAGLQECKEGTMCKKLFDSEHMRTFRHPFLPPCKNALGCTDMSQEHLVKCSHLCPNGNMCSALNDPNHCKYFVHVGTMCMNQQCADTSEEHMRMYMHPGVPAVRPRCGAEFCTDYSVEHRRMYAHNPYEKMGNAVVRMHNSRDLGGKTYGDFSEAKDFVVDFVEGMDYWLKQLNANPQGALDMNSKNVRDVVNWMHVLRPVNMCSAAVLSSVARLGIVGSTVRLQSFWMLRDDIVDRVLARRAIQDIYPWDAPSLKRAKKYCKKYVRLQQGIIGPKKLAECTKKSAELVKTGGNNLDDRTFKKLLEKYDNLINMYKGTPAVSNTKEGEINEQRINAVRHFGKDDTAKGEHIVATIEREARDFLESVGLLLDNMGGVGCDVDKDVRTDHTVFAIVGPHMDNYGGAEAALIFSKTIMYHPDYYMLPEAATLYSFGQYHSAKYKTGPAMNRTAWMGPNKPFGAGGKEAFRLQKFHPIEPRWEEAAAKEFIYQTAQLFRRRPTEVTLPDVIKFWKESNSHFVIEGHLPSAVTLDYVEHAILQRTGYETMLRDGGESAALIRKWEARPGFLQVVNSAAELKEANATYFAQHQPRDVPSGFTFVISGKDTKEIFIPYRVREGAPRVSIRFAALGGKIFVTLSNIGDIKDKKVDRKTITFGLSKDMSIMSAYYSPPANCVSSEEAACTGEFSAGCDTTSFIEYEIVIDYAAGTATIRHVGYSALFNDACVTVKLQNSRYDYISFSSSIDSEPRPRIANLNFNY